MIKRHPKAFKPISLCDLESIERLLLSAYKVFGATEAYIRIWNYLFGKRPDKKSAVRIKANITTGVPILSAKVTVIPPEA